MCVMRISKIPFLFCFFFAVLEDIDDSCQNNGSENADAKRVTFFWNRLPDDYSNHERPSKLAERGGVDRGECLKFILIFMIMQTSRTYEVRSLLTLFTFFYIRLITFCFFLHSHLILLLSGKKNISGY